MVHPAQIKFGLDSCREAMASGFGVTSTNVEGHAVLRETNNRNRQ
jgi:hypothetical protein